MTQKFFDITRAMHPAMAVWPGDTPFSIETIMDINRGDPVNLTTLTLSSHTGSHADAPAHFTADGLPLDQLPLEPYIGPVTVVSLSKKTGPLFPADFPALDWFRLERLLIHTQASHLPPEQFPTNFVYPSPELADFLGSHGVLLFGSDAPSMDALDSETYPGHQALRRHNIAILESLQLKEVPAGNYELIALPLKIKNGDGSPVRAILRTIQ
jgi:arylformamidase